MMFKSRIFVNAISISSVLIAGAVMAQDIEPTESQLPTLEESTNTELPEKVAQLVDAMSGVQRVEKLESGLFAVERRIRVTGSRIRREVTLEIDENGQVVDWGRTPFYTRTYTRRELVETGRIDLAEALDQLDPAIQSRSGG